MTLTGAEHAIPMEAQHALDRRRQLVDGYATGFGQILLADGAGERLRRVPDFAHEGEHLVFALLLFRRRGVPGVKRFHRLGAGHALDLHEPVDAVTAPLAAMAVEMVGI